MNLALSSFAVLAAIFLALGLGLGLGWLLWARTTARELPPLRLMIDALRDERDAARLALTAAEIGAARLPALEAQLDEARRTNLELAQAKAAFERGERERADAHAAQLAQLKEMEVKVEDRFRQLASQAMTEAQTQFLKRAEERLGEQGQKHEGQIKALLQPVETTLKRYEENLAKVEEARVGSYGELKEAMSQLTLGNENVRRETQRLANVMRASPKARGRWGEEQLRTILESAGLAENVDFQAEVSVAGDERRLRPDFIVNLPGNRCIVIDVKNVWVAYEQAFEEEDDALRADLLLQHANALKHHASELGKKGYWRQFDRSPDFVIMFVPGEHILAAAAQRAPDLIETAFRNGVIVASTINMLGLAKVMAGMWRQETLASQAKEIAEVGKELYKRLATMGGHISQLGRHLNQTVGSYNKFASSLERNVLTQAKRFEALKVDTGSAAMDDPPVIESLAQPLTKLIAQEEYADVPADLDPQ